MGKFCFNAFQYTWHSHIISIHKHKIYIHHLIQSCTHNHHPRWDLHSMPTWEGKKHLKSNWKCNCLQQELFSPIFRNPISTIPSINLKTKLLISTDNRYGTNKLCILKNYTHFILIALMNENSSHTKYYLKYSKLKLMQLYDLECDL